MHLNATDDANVDRQMDGQAEKLTLLLVNMTCPVLASKQCRSRSVGV